MKTEMPTVKTYDMTFELWANGKPYWNAGKVLVSEHGVEVKTTSPKCIALQESIRMMHVKYDGKGYLFPEIRVTKFEEVAEHG